MVDLEFIRKNLLSLHTSLENPAQELKRSDNTILVEFVDITKDYKTVTRQKRGNALQRFAISRSRVSFWEVPAKIYEVRPATRGNRHAFPAYICPYQDNSVQNMTLAHAADIMFTGDMNGCTFGVGIPASDGAVRVAHANAGRHATGRNKWTANYAPQREEQDRMLALARADAHTVQPSAYRDNPPEKSEVNAITIGLRDTKRKAWDFYYQKQQADGGDLRNLMELIKVN